MADVTAKTEELEVAPAFSAYSRVVIYTGKQDEDGNDIIYAAGDTTGYTLEMENPWASQAIADDILESIRGFPYKPYTATKAKLNPAFEIGDSITVDNVFSGVYQYETDYKQAIFTSNLKAPCEEEIDHEYQFKDSKETEYERRINEAVARLNFFADSIEAKVDKVSDGSTFGWRLTENGWSVFNQTGNIFTVDASGASVTGEIKATTGTIGGFDIGSRGISSNNQSYGGQEQTGVYIGVDGIQLGTRFRVDAAGNLYAGSGNFDGNVYAKNIQYGTGSGGQNYGYFSGGGISLASLGTPQLMQGVVNSLGWADFAADVFNKVDTSEWIYTKRVLATNYVSAPTYYVDYGGGQQGSVNTHTHHVTVSGNTVTIGSPDFTGTPHPFEVAPSNVTISLNGSATYQSGNNRYAVPVRATGSDGAVVGTGTVYVGASAAYNAGYSSACNRVAIQIVEGGSWDGKTYYTIYASVDGTRYASVACYAQNSYLHW